MDWMMERSEFEFQEEERFYQFSKAPRPILEAVRFVLTEQR
jgi:hypothetical protein